MLRCVLFFCCVCCCFVGQLLVFEGVCLGRCLLKLPFFGGGGVLKFYGFESSFFLFKATSPGLGSPTWCSLPHQLGGSWWINQRRIFSPLKFQWLVGRLVQMIHLTVWGKLGLFSGGVCC